MHWGMSQTLLEFEAAVLRPQNGGVTKQRRNRHEEESQKSKGCQVEGVIGA